MNNYEISAFEYLKNDLKNMFNDSTEMIRPCTIDELVKISRLLDLPYVGRILYFSIVPNHYSAIHIDKSMHSSNSVDFALNIPITSCDNIYMNWFENLSTTHKVYYPVNKNHATPIIETKNAKTIDTVNLNSPMFVKISDWHNIENRSIDTVEKLISIRFFQKTTIDDVKKALGLS